MNNGRNQPVWAWIAASAATITTGVLIYVLTGHDKRIGDSENGLRQVTSQVSGLVAIVDQIRVITMERNTQAHEGYQRLARVEGTVDDLKKAVADGRAEVRAELREIHSAINKLTAAAPGK